MGRMDTRRQAGQTRTKSETGASYTRGRRNHPNAPSPSSSHPDPAEQEGASLPSAKVRTGIVSVNGQDVGVMHCHRP